MNNEELETPVVTDPLEETVVPAVEPPPAPEVKRWEYQPTDEQGRPMGAKQVIKYTTTDDLAAKLTEQNTLLIRKLRSETRKNRLGIGDQEELSGEPQRFQEPIAFNAKSLSPEDQFALARKLGVDPEEFDSVTDELFEVKFGVKPDVLRQTLTELQEERYNARALAQCNAFIKANPSYVPCMENHEAITAWMMNKKLAPVQSNFQLAYDTLSTAGVLIATFAETLEDPDPEPIVAAEPVVEVIPEPALEVVPEPLPVVPPAPPEYKPAGIPSGFTRETAGDSGPTPNIGDGIVFDVVQNGVRRHYTGLAAIAAMPADEYKRRVQTDPNFTKTETALEKDAAERRRNRR